MTMPALELDRHLDAPRDAVWRAWTEPALMEQWYCPNPQWRLAVTADVRVDGAWSIRMGDSFEVGGRYLSVARPRLLGFTWAWVHEGVEQTVSTVEVELIPAGSGTRLLLHHSDLPSRPDVDSHALGWRRCLDRLAALRLSPEP